MAKMISEFIQESENGVISSSVSLEQSYAEMSIAASIATAYCECAAAVEFCEANNIQYVNESVMDKLKDAGKKAGNFFKMVITFLKNLVRNIGNAIAADRIEKTIGIYKAEFRDNMDTKLMIITPDIEKLLDDIADFSTFLKKGYDDSVFTDGNLNADNVDDYEGAMRDWIAELPAYVDDIKSDEGLAKRYGTKEQSLTIYEYIDFLRKIKDSKSNVKVSKIMKDFDKSIANMKDENGEPKVSSDVVKSIKSVANAFVKVYEKFYASISKNEYKDAKKDRKTFDKNTRNDAQEYTKDERSRKATEYYV